MNIEEIEAREEAATEGPWVAKRNLAVGRVLWWRIQDKITGFIAMITSDGPPDENPANAEFIAHAREDIPYLQAQLRQAQEERDRARKALVCRDCGKQKPYVAICFDCLNGDVEEIARWHKEVTISDTNGSWDECSQCNTPWPCDAIRALKLRDAAIERGAFMIRGLYARYRLARASAHESVRAAAEQRALAERLAEELETARVALQALTPAEAFRAESPQSGQEEGG